LFVERCLWGCKCNDWWWQETLSRFLNPKNRPLLRFDKGMFERDSQALSICFWMPQQRWKCCRKWCITPCNLAKQNWSIE
jgi:hypothetical protein